MNKILIAIIILFISKNTFGQTHTVTEWQTNKKLFEITQEEARNYQTNELILNYSKDNGIFSNPTTGVRMFELNNEKLSDVETGVKLYEYKNKKIIDIKTGKTIYIIDSSDKTISEFESSKKLLSYSGDFHTYRIYFILIAGGYIKK